MDCERPIFFELEGDFSHLNGSYLNSVEISKANQEELSEILYDENWDLKVNKLSAPTKDWDHFVIVGFIP